MQRSRNSSASDSDSDSDNQANLLDIRFDDLDKVCLTEEEKKEFLEYQASDSTVSSRGPSEDDTISQQPYIHSHKKLLEFLKTTGRGKAELLATHKWNSEAQKVYKLFNITTRIVHPDYFFASETWPNNKSTTILAELEKMNKKMLSKTYYPWSYLKKHLEPFLDSFVGFEKLADVFHVHEIAVPLKNTFASNIERAEMNANDGWYEPFTNWTDQLVEEPEDISEGTFQEYIETLFKQLSVITNGRFSLRSKDLKLILPAQEPHQEKKMSVKPDIMVQAKIPEIMLVGEVKPFGCSVLENQEHRGRTVHQIEPDISNLTLDADQPRGQGDQLSPTVNEKDIPVPSVTADELGAGTGKEQTPSSTKRKKATIPSRSLDRVEEFKVSKYLPQLFGHMLAALEQNERRTYRLKFCQMYENVQFGFAVEGFKLRFVKLTMIDVLKKERPTVRALLSGKMIKCQISITQEFNLLKRRHLEMFYQMLLAMRYLCR